MKKIIIFLSVLCLLVSCFTISTFAAESYTITAGDWVGKDTPTLLNVGHDINFTVDGKEYIRISSMDNQILYSYEWFLSSGSKDAYLVSNDGWQENYQTINVTEDTVVSVDFYNWFVSNYYRADEIPTECDGTACNVRDVDLNNVCDTCGLVLTYNLRSTLFDYAHRTIETTITNNTIPNAQYWLIVTQGDEYYLYMSAKKFYAVGGKLYAGADESEQGAIHRCRVYAKDDGTFTNSGWSTQPIGIDFDRSNLADSSHGTSFFFQIPLWEEIQGVAEGQIQNKTLPKLGGTMTTLVICGISLVALVVLLVLLSKKFRIFLH